VDIYLLSYIPAAEEAVAAAGLASLQEVEVPDLVKRISENEVERFWSVARELWLSSVEDFPTIIFYVRGVSRAFSHQLVRHRIAAYIQRSQRYALVGEGRSELLAREGELPFIVPPEIVKKGVEQTLHYLRFQLGALHRYRELVSMDVPLEDARFVLTNAFKTALAVWMNAEEIHHVIGLRACFDAQWEMRAFAYALLALAKHVYPRVFHTAGPYCISRNRCRGRGRWKCKPQAEQLVKAVEHRLHEQAASGVVDLTDLVGYHAPPEVEHAVAEALKLSNISLSYPVRIHLTPPIPPTE